MPEKSRTLQWTFFGQIQDKFYRLILSFSREFNFRVLALSENIGHRAAIYVEEYSLFHGPYAGDAIIAATATESGLTLCTSNARHYKLIKDLRLRPFKP